MKCSKLCSNTSLRLYNRIHHTLIHIQFSLPHIRTFCKNAQITVRILILCGWMGALVSCETVVKSGNFIIEARAYSNYTIIKLLKNRVMFIFLLRCVYQQHNHKAIQLYQIIFSLRPRVIRNDHAAVRS